MLFKICNKCGQQWETRGDFLSDSTITLVGYQVFFEDLTMGLFLFNHSCKTTIAIDAGLFLDLYTGPIYTERVNRKKDCPGRCLNENIQSPCSEQCRCFFINQIMKKIKEYAASS